MSSLRDIIKYKKREDNSGQKESAQGTQAQRSTTGRKPLVEMPEIKRQSRNQRESWLSQMKLDKVNALAERANQFTTRAYDDAKTRETGFTSVEQFGTYMDNHMNPTLNVYERDVADAQAMLDAEFAGTDVYGQAAELLGKGLDASGKVRGALEEEAGYWRQFKDEADYRLQKAAAEQAAAQEAARKEKREQLLAMDIAAEVARLAEMEAADYDAMYRQGLSLYQENAKDIEQWTKPREGTGYSPDPQANREKTAAGRGRQYSTPESDLGRTRGFEPSAEVEEALKPFHDAIVQVEQSKEEIAKLKANIREATRLQNVASYDEYLQAEDFAEVSARRSDDAMSVTRNIINSTPEEKEEMMKSQDAALLSGVAKYDLMTDTEKSLYNYLFETQGEASAGKYLEEIDFDLNERYMLDVQESMTRYAEENPFWASVSSVILTPMTGLGSLYSIVRGLQGKEIDPNSPYFGATVAQEAQRVAVAQGIRDAVEIEWLGNAAAFLYQTGMTITDSAVLRYMLGGLGVASSSAQSTIMGMGAMSSTTRDVLERGGTQEQALQSGIVAGVAEVFFEHVSIDRFVKATSPAARAALVKNVLKRAGIEASEELLTEVTNLFADKRIMGDLSEFEMKVDLYKRAGLTEAEAQRRVWGDMAKQVGLAALGGALSGGVMGGVAGGVSTYNTMQQGRGLRVDPDVATGLVEVGLEAPKGSLAQTMAAQNQGRNMGNLQTGRQYLANLEALTPQQTAAMLLENEDALSTVRTVQDALPDVARKVDSARIDTEQWQGRLQDVLREQSQAQGIFALERLAEEMVRGEQDTVVGRYGMRDLGALPLPSAQWSAPLAPTDGTTGRDNAQTSQFINAQEAEARFAPATEMGGEMDAEAPVALSEATFAQSGQPVEIARIEAVRDGEVYVKLADGGTARAGNLSFADSRAAQLYEAAADYTQRGAAALLERYEKSRAPMDVYLMGFKRLYQNGMAGIDFERTRTGSQAAQYLDPITQKMAYDAGVEAAKGLPAAQVVRRGEAVALAEGMEKVAVPVKEEAKPKTKPQAKPAERKAGDAPREGAQGKTEADAETEPGVHRRDSRKKLKRKQEAELEVLDAMAKRAGLVIITEDRHAQAARVNGERVLQSVNGMYRTGSNEIHIAIDGIKGSVLYVGTHEMLHFVRDWNADGYALLRDYTLNALQEKHTDYDLDGRVEALRRKQPGLTREMAIEEIVADALPSIWADETNVRMLVQDAPTLAEKIHEFLREFVEYIRQVIAEISGEGRPEARMLMQDVEALQTIGAMFDDALMVAAEGRQAQRVGTEVGLSRDVASFVYSVEPIDLSAEQVEENYRKAARMQSVVTLKGTEFAKSPGKLADRVTAFFESIGGEVENELLGQVKLSRSGVKSSVAHGNSRIKTIAFAAVPEIIRNGTIVDYRQNWKGRDYDTAVIAAPFSMRGGEHAGEYFGLAIVMRNAQTQRLYLHEAMAIKKSRNVALNSTTPGRIRTHDNGSFVGKEAVASDAPANSLAGDTGVLTPHSILQKLLDVYYREEGGLFRFSMEPVELTPKQAEANIRKAARMANVTKLEGTEFEKGAVGLVDQVTAYFEEIGGTIRHELIGEIRLTRHSAQSSVAHGVGRMKAMAFAAVPDILQYGELVDYQTNRKGRDYDSLVLAAPFAVESGSYAGEYYGVAVVARRTETQEFYLHEVRAIEKNRHVVLDSATPGRTPTNVNGSFVSKATVASDAPANSLAGDTGGLTLESILQKMVAVHQEQNRFSMDTERMFHAGEAAAQTAEEAAQALQAEYARVAAHGDAMLGRETARGVARAILREAKSGYDVELLTDELRARFRALEGGQPVRAFMADMVELAGDVLAKSGRLDTQMYDEYSDMRKYFRTMPIALTEAQQAEVASGWDSVEAFRRENMGRLRISKEGASLDSLWAEISGQWPMLFDPDTREGDQPRAVVDALNAVRKVYVADGFDMDSRAAGNELALRMFDRFLGETEAGRVDAALQTLRSQSREKVLAYEAALKKEYKKRFDDFRRAEIRKRQELAARMNQAHGTEKARLREQMRAAVQKKQMALEEQRAEFRQRFKEDRARRLQREDIVKYRKRIMQDAQALHTAITAPTTAKHVPGFLQEAVGGVLQNIDFTIRDEGSRAAKNWLQSVEVLAAHMENYVRANSTDDAVAASVPNAELYQSVYMSLHPDFLPRLQDFIDRAKAMGPVRLGELDAGQLQELSNIVAIVRGAVNSINKLYTNLKYQEASDAGDALIDYTKSKEAKQAVGYLMGTVRNFLNVDMLSSYDYGMMLGDAGEAAMDMLSRGQEKAFVRHREAAEYVKGLYKKHRFSEKELRKWGGEVKTYKLNDERSVQMTTAQAMELYVLMKRQQALTHLFGDAHTLGGGLRPDAIDVKGKRVEQLESAQVLEPYARVIVSGLTDQQKAIADDMQAYLSSTVAGWGNETSQQLYLVDLYTEKNYWPIRVDQASVRVQEPGRERAYNAVRTASFTKQTKQHAANPVVIGDIFQTFSAHVAQMAAYNGLALPIDDAMRILNYTQRDEKGMPDYNANTRKAIEKLMGRGGVRYFTNLIQDLNGLSSRAFSTELSGMLAGNAKRAAVAGKVRVVIQQPTAYLRAMAVLSPKYLVGTLPKKGSIAKMMEICPIAWWKSNGHYEVGVGRSTHSMLWGDLSFTERVVDKAMKPAGYMDDITWATIFEAVQKEVRDTQRGLAPESAEYWDAVRTRFSEVVNRTQVVDSVMHRPQVLRSKDTGLRAITAFMSEPIKSYNLMRTAFAQLRQDPKNAEYRHKTGMAIAAVVSANLLNALVVSLWDAMRKKKKEEEYWDRYLEELGGNVVDNLAPWGWIPYVSEIVSIVQGYSSSNMEFDAISSLYYALTDIYKTMRGESKKSAYAVASQTIKAVSNLAGMPFGGLLDNVEGIANFFAPGVLRKEHELASVEDMYRVRMEAIRVGDREKDARIVERLRAGNDNFEAKTYDEIDAGMRAMLRKEDPRIDTAARARMAGGRGQAEYERIVREMKAEGFKQDVIIGAINAQINAIQNPKKEKEDLDEDLTLSLYGYDDLKKELLSGNASGVDRVLAVLHAEGKTFENIRSATTSRVRPVYLEMYEKGDEAGMDRLESLLTEKLEYDEADFARWVDPTPYAALKEELKGGDAPGITRQIEILMGKGKTVPDIQAQITSEEKTKFLEAYYAGDSQTMQQTMWTLMQLGYVKYTEDTFEDWVRADMRSNLYEMIEEGDVPTARQWAQRLIQSGVKERTLIGQIENKFKAIYQGYVRAGDRARQEALHRTLKGLGISEGRIAGWLR